MSTSPAQWPQQFDVAHQKIADFLGVQRREQILLTPGCTSALTVAIGDLFIPDGRRVLTSRWEHHALHRPLLKRAATGVPIEYIPAQMDNATGESVSPIDLDWLEQSLASDDVGLIAITAACNVTGDLLPYEDVIRLAQRHCVPVLLDAAQIVGWKRLDLPALGADLVAFGGHKGLQGPWGLGGLYLSGRVQMDCSSAACELPRAGRGGGQSPRPGYCDVGSVDQFALAGLQAAIGMLRERNLDADLTAARGQLQRIVDWLRTVDRVRIHAAAESTRRMPTLAFEVSGLSSGAFAQLCRQHALVVGSGLHCAPLAHQTMGTHHAGLVRLSVGLGQPDQEIEKAIDRLPAVFHAAFR